MPKDYTVQALQLVGEKDQHGNQAYSVKFAEEADSVFMKAQKAPVEGGKEHGVISEETGKSGKKYRRFKRVAKENFKPRGKEDPAKQDSIMKMNALNNAVAFWAYASNGKIDNMIGPDVIETAGVFYAWLKGDDKVVDAKDVPELEEILDDPEFK